jgi:hypothetical protein
VRADPLATLESGRRARPSRGATLSAIARLAAAPPRNPGDLVRLHEALLFHAAYPENASVRARAVALLARLPAVVAKIAAAEEDLSALDLPESAGIGGTRIATTFTYDFLRTLARRHPDTVRVDWEAFDREDRLGATFPRFVPLLEEEALADANVPLRSWLDAARGRRRELSWTLERFESLALPPAERAELFDGVGLPVLWELSGEESRTLARSPDRPLFLHPGPLLARRDVDVARELSSRRLVLRDLSVREAERRLAFARDATGVRYRELYGFTYGDPRTARTADAGRGCEITLYGLPPERRLPLRAGFAAFVTKNSIPVAYVEGLALFERIEVGFNVYYTFREGESAWIYATILKLFREALGATSFSVDPYQIGFENEEAIESGAFWFYRRLGFRSTSAELRARTDREEIRLAEDPRRRTPARLLRRLAQRNMLYDAERSGGGWDHFHIRRIGLAVGRRTASEFGGDAARARRVAAGRVARRLGVDLGGWTPEGRRAFESLALVLDLVPELPRWTREEKDGAVRVLRAKSSRDETRYLRLMRRHGKMRAAMLRLGSSGS